MSTFLEIASKCSWLGVGVCLVLAILSAPQPANADEYGECTAACAGKDIMSGEYQACIDACIAAQCPDKIANGKYVGCVAPGGKCVLPGKNSTCGDSISGTSCTCLP